ncbi:MAG: tetratricopeptide repeat protein [Phycisphaera sp.]|nr:tetratricopeptide repeat protein [Phycisphaera sp.]
MASSQRITRKAQRCATGGSSASASDGWLFHWRTSRQWHPIHNLTTCMAKGCILLLMVASLAPPALADDEPPKVAWTGKDLSGKALTVPDANKPTVIVFLMAGQERSERAATQLLEQVKPSDDVNVIGAVSGEAAEVKARSVLDKIPGWKYPMVADEGFEASGAMDVHVWPTTLVIDTQGHVVAHLAGLNDSYAGDLSAYIDFVLGKTDRQALEQALNNHNEVTDSGEQVAQRHLRVAERLLEKDRVREARLQLEAGLKLSPDDVSLQLMMTDVLLLSDEPAQALALLDKVKADGIAPWRIGTLRGRALVALGRFDEARPVVESAVKLNPHPAMAYYLSGRVHEAAGEWEQAAQSYRAAFEHSGEGKDLSSKERQGK